MLDATLPDPSSCPSSPSLYWDCGAGVGGDLGGDAARAAPAEDWTSPQVSQWLQRVVGSRTPLAEVRRVLGTPSGAALLTLSRKDFAQLGAVGALIRDALVDAKEGTPAPALAPAPAPASPPSLGMFAEDTLLGFGPFLEAEVYPQPASNRSAVTELDSSQRWMASQSDGLSPHHAAPLLSPQPSYEELLPLSPLQCQSSEFSWPCSAHFMQQTSDTDTVTFADLTSPGSVGGNQEVPEWGSPRTVFSPASSPCTVTGMSPPATPASTAAPRRGGRPRRPAGAPAPVRIRRRSGSGETTPGKGRLWQFILELLQDKSNGSIVRWEDEQDGVFCFVDGHRAAELWGQRKYREKPMTYEKMSRTMRTYKNGAFAPHPRRLFYKFGPKATWAEKREVCRG